MNLALQAARKSAGLTQRQVALKSGITEHTYQRYEYEEREPGVRTAIRIADALNVTDLRKLFSPAPDVPQSLTDIVPEQGQK